MSFRFEVEFEQFKTKIKKAKNIVEVFCVFVSFLRFFNQLPIKSFLGLFLCFSNRIFLMTKIFDLYRENQDQN